MCERFGIVCIAACRRSRSRLVRLDRPCRRSRTRWRERQLGVASSIVRAFSRARRGWPRALLDPTTPPGHRGRDKLVSKIAGTAWRMTSADAFVSFCFIAATGAVAHQNGRFRAQMRVGWIGASPLLLTTHRASATRVPDVPGRSRPGSKDSIATIHRNRGGHAPDRTGERTGARHKPMERMPRR